MHVEISIGEIVNFYTIAFSLFIVINATGNIPLFVSLLARFSLKDQRRIIIRELLIALAVLLLFNFFGDYVLLALHITQPVIGVGGGILLFLIAITMIFPKHSMEEPPINEPIFVPLAMPIIAGPGSITLVMNSSQQLHNAWLMTAAIFLAWVPSLLILLAASNIKYFLGKKGLMAIERLGGMVITLIAISMVIRGILDLVKDHFAL